ncbi:MAG TPA: hypothetical protein PKA63_00115 [Oligoflexia bacterium]|nr:hypothetical protein [Oligoflexia bacterium]HMP47052.1 hypothetical protein [Oligoflexia bacterium]
MLHLFKYVVVGEIRWCFFLLNNMLNECRPNTFFFSFVLTAICISIYGIILSVPPDIVLDGDASYFLGLAE